jgi:hypothetical protein
MTDGPKIASGGALPFEQVETITGQSVRLKGAAGLAHIQLRRFAACPLCNFHLAQYGTRAKELLSLDTMPVVVFHSSKSAILDNSEGMEWLTSIQLVSDPERHLYRKVGAELSGWKYLFRLRAKTLRAVRLSSIMRLLRIRNWGAEAGLTQRPMDILVDRAAGEVVDYHYGIDPGDQWNVDEVVDRVRSFRAERKQGPNG